MEKISKLAKVVATEARKVTKKANRVSKKANRVDDDYTWDDFDSDINSMWDLINFCNDNGLDGYLDEYLSYDAAEDFLKTQEGLARIWYCIRGIKNPQADWFRIDGYGNLEDMTESISEIKERVWEEFEKTR